MSSVINMLRYEQKQHISGSVGGFDCVFCFKTKFNDTPREELNSVQELAAFDLFNMFTQLIKGSFFFYINI